MDLSELKGIISLMQKSDLTELEIETKELKLRLGRPGSDRVVTAITPAPNIQLPASTPPVPSPKIYKTSLPIKKRIALNHQW